MLLLLELEFVRLNEKFGVGHQKQHAQSRLILWHPDQIMLR